MKARFAIAVALALAAVGVVPAHAVGTPTFAQQATGHGRTLPQLDVALGSDVTVGNRIVVQDERPDGVADGDGGPEGCVVIGAAQ